MKNSQRQMIVPGLGEVIINKTNDGRKQAIMKESSFLVSACGDNNEEAIAQLRQNYKKVLDGVRDSD